METRSQARIKTQEMADQEAIAQHRNQRDSISPDNHNFGLETRSQARSNIQEVEDRGNIAPDRNQRDLEMPMDDHSLERITGTLIEIKQFILKSQAEKKELENQVNDLLQILESQRLEIRRLTMSTNERFQDIEARLVNLEDNRTKGVLLSFIEEKLDEVKQAIERVESLEVKLKRKIEEPRAESTDYLYSIPKARSDMDGLRKSSKPIQLPPAYDGSTPWEAYYAQFDIVARLNKWSLEEKALFLATSLKGIATLILSNISEENRGDFDILVKALSNRFGATHQSELARAKFKSRFKRRDESLPELASDLERLVKLAYPQAESELQDTLAKDQFIDALPDDESRMRVRTGRPQNIQHALEVALEIESYHLADRWSHRAARQVNRLDAGTDVNKEVVPETSVDMEISRLGTLIEQVLDEVKQKQQRKPERQKVQCYHCHEVGHYQSECPRFVFQNSGGRGFSREISQRQGGYRNAGWNSQFQVPNQRHQDNSGNPRYRQEETGSPHQVNYQRPSPRGRARPM